MANVMQLMPSLESDEMVYIQGLLKDMSDTSAQQFAISTTAAGRILKPFLDFTSWIYRRCGCPSIYFGPDRNGLALPPYGRLCFIGTIIDLVNYKKLTFDYNTKVAQQVAVMIKASN